MSFVIITGGTGLIGTALTRSLADKGHNIIILSRQKINSSNEDIQYAQWDPQKKMYAETAIREADYIINLAGANLADKRWTEKRKKLIVESRVQAGQTIVKALQEVPNKVEAVISASAIGWYGTDANDTSPKPFTEDAPPADDFLADTCRQWEAAISPVNNLGKRLVILRTGIVLSRAGGAYPQFRWPLKFGMAPVLGSGGQIYSWIHIDDLVNMYIFAIENQALNGVYNAVSPLPVSNRDMVKAILKGNRKKGLLLPVPAFVIKTAFGEVSTEVLKSTTVSPAKIQKAGFQFSYPEMITAIRQLEHP